MTFLLWRIRGSSSRSHSSSGNAASRLARKNGSSIPADFELAEAISRFLATSANEPKMPCTERFTSADGSTRSGTRYTCIPALTAAVAPASESSRTKQREGEVFDPVRRKQE